MDTIPNGDDLNVHNLNGHDLNEHDLNGHDLNGHDLNGHNPKCAFTFIYDLKLLHRYCLVKILLQRQ